MDDSPHQKTLFPITQEEVAHMRLSICPRPLHPRVPFTVTINPMTHPECLTHLYNLCLEAQMFKDSKCALSGLHFPFCQRHAQPSFPSHRCSHCRLFTVTIKPLNSGPKNHPRHPYPSKVSKGSRPGPSPVTRKGTLTNTRRFLERMAARAEL